MSEFIELNPELLLDQSRQLLTLHGSFDSLFDGILSDLKGLNECWSNLLSNNFSGKIGSAQRSFLGSLNMMKISGDAAKRVAETLLGLDTKWASKFSGQFSDLKSPQAIYEMLSQSVSEAMSNYKSLGEFAKEKIDEMPSSTKAWLDYIKGKAFKEAFGDNKDAVEAAQKIMNGDFGGAAELIGKKGVQELAEKYVDVMGIDIANSDLKKYVSYSINVAKDGISAVTECIMDPSLENLAKIPWSVTVQPVLDTAGKDIAKIVSRIPGVSEYYDDRGGVDIGSMASTALGDFYGIVTGNESTKEYAASYYKESGGVFEGFTRCVKDVVSFAQESGGVGEAAKSFGKTWLKDAGDVVDNVADTLGIIYKNGGFVSSTFKGFADIVNDSFISKFK